MDVGEKLDMGVVVVVAFNGCLHAAYLVLMYKASSGKDWSLWFLTAYVDMYIRSSVNNTKL